MFGFRKKRNSDHGPLVLLVGHCTPDSIGLKRLVRRAAPEASCERVMSEDRLRELAPVASLALVNRKLDGRFEDDEGVSLIRRLGERHRDGESLRVMLISNFDEAQAAAVELGALRGFGKSAVRSEEAATLVRRALDAASA